jgi:catechol 2,3-dioxygenase
MATDPHLGHVHLRVRELDRAVAFYRDVLDLAVSERLDRFAFLTFGRHHHDVALQAVGPDAAGPGSGVGLYHAAVEVPDRDALDAVHNRLRDRDVATSLVDHGISHALYFQDPDGNGLEAYVDTRNGEDAAWGGQTEPL